MSQYSEQPPYAAPTTMGAPGTLAPKTSGLAIASLVLGIASFIFSCLAGGLAIILGIIAHSKISKSGGQVTGGGLATAGIITGSIGTLLSVVILAGMLLPAVQQVRLAARRVTTLNNARQILLANHNHESARMQFVSNISPQHPEAGELLSWRVHLLPFIGRQDLHDQFHLDEPWNSPHNIALLPQMPLVYEHLQAEVPEGHTVMQMPTSKAGSDPSAILTQGENGFGFGDVTDGGPNTVMVIEVAAQAAVPWTKPADWQFDPNNPRQNFGDSFPGGTVFGMSDGSTNFIDTDQLSDADLNAIFTKNGGEQAPQLPY